MSILNPLPDLTGGVLKPRPIQAPKPRIPTTSTPAPRSIVTLPSRGGSSRGGNKADISSTGTTTSPPSYTPQPIFDSPIVHDSYFAPRQGWQRVKDIFTFNYSGETLGILGSQKPAGRAASGALKSITAISELGSLAYGASFLIPTAGTAGAATTAAAGTSIFKTAAVAGGIGVLGGLFLGRGGSQTQNQTTNTTQITNTYQTTNTSQDTQNIQYVIGSPGASPQLFGNPSQSVSPQQTVTPSVDVSPSQSQQSGTDWTLIVLLAVGAFVLTRK